MASRSRSRQILFLVSDEEKAKYREIAYSSGLTLSAWMRVTLNNAVNPVTLREKKATYSTKEKVSP